LLRLPAVVSENQYEKKCVKQISMICYNHAEHEMIRKSFRVSMQTESVARATDS